KVTRRPKASDYQRL
nr:Chain P, Trans-Golgi network integral membrane protein TGN38 [Rattus norvegicus]